MEVQSAMDMGRGGASEARGENDSKNGAAPSTGGTNEGTKSAVGASEDFLIFGARPSHLFDDIALAVDSLLAEEVASLPLLPRTLTEQERQQAENTDEGNAGPQTGEEKLLGKLRKAYTKNIALAEKYCSRNVFTVQSYSKTRRRKILERYLGHDDEDSNKTVEAGKNSDDVTPLPSITFGPPEGELPSPEQIVAMDKEILVARQRLQQQKQRRILLKRQLERLGEASQTLTGVRKALKQRLDEHSDEGDVGDGLSLEKLRESVLSAMKGHEELKAWNAQADEVIKILDKIKVEREEGKAPNDKATRKVTKREQDERIRKRFLVADGGNDSYGTKDQAESLLKKMRGK
ncbi:hypothetical protein ACHAWF_018249 [Thalassiosira exigua]